MFNINLYIHFFNFIPYLKKKLNKNKYKLTYLFLLMYFSGKQSSNIFHSLNIYISCRFTHTNDVTIQWPLSPLILISNDFTLILFLFLHVFYYNVIICTIVFNVIKIYVACLLAYRNALILTFWCIQKITFVPIITSKIHLN